MKLAPLSLLLVACTHSAGEADGGDPGGVTVLASWDAASGVGFSEIVVDDTHVYWTGVDVLRVPKRGGDVEIVAAGERTPSGIAIDATAVYWTNQDDGTVRSIPLGGGDVVTLASGQDRPTDLVVDGDNLYWLTRGNGSDGTVMKLPLGGGPPVAVATGQRYLTGLDVDATHVYWVDTEAGAIQRAPIAGGAATTIATSTQPWEVAVAGGEVYWTSPTSILSAPVTGGSWTELASGEIQARGIAVDDAAVYWTDLVYWDLEMDGGLADGAVGAVSRSGGAASTIAAQQNGPNAIAADGEAVYWINEFEAALKRATPPAS